MKTTASLSIGTSSAALTWVAIDWQAIKNQVRRLQMRMAKANPAHMTGLRAWAA